MLSTLFSAGINIVLNFVLIPTIGIMGATTATAVAYVFIALYRMFDTRRYFKFQINFIKEFITYIIVCISAFFVTIDRIGYIVSAVAILVIMLINLKEMRKLLIAGLSFLHLR